MIMRKMRALILIVIVCVIMTLTACRGIASESSLNYDLGDEAGKESGIDVHTTNPEQTISPEKGLVHQEYSYMVKLRIQGEEFNLEQDDAKIVKKLFDRNTMIESETGGTSESFLAYEFIMEDSFYGVTEDLVRVEALIKTEDDYINYVKQLTEEECEALKNIISNYK